MGANLYSPRPISSAICRESESKSGWRLRNSFTSLRERLPLRNFSMQSRTNAGSVMRLCLQYVFIKAIRGMLAAFGHVAYRSRA